MNKLLIANAILSIIVFLWATIMIYSFLRNRSEKLESYIFINFFIFKYIDKYKTITRRETGRIGYLYYLWIISINTALFCVGLSLVIGH